MKYFILCLMIAFVFSETEYDESPCEQTEDPSGIVDCKGKQTEFTYEICCYAVSKMEYEPDVESHDCLDIVAEDVTTPEGLERVKQLIEQGKYWENYTEKSTITEFVCSAEKTLYSLFSIMILGLLL